MLLRNEFRMEETNLNRILSTRLRPIALFERDGAVIQAGNSASGIAEIEGWPVARDKWRTPSARLRREDRDLRPESQNEGQAGLTGVQTRCSGGSKEGTAVPCSAASPAATRKSNRGRSCWRQLAT